MARKKKTKKKIAVETYKHESAKRKNIPTAKMAGEGKIPKVEKANYSYSPHLPPELRFDTSGQSDRVTEIVEKAVDGRKLSSEEAGILSGVAANGSQPWLEWSGKKEEHDRGMLEVEPVALHIHERVSANAIIRAAKREDIQADLFADPKQEYKEAIQFYRHDVDWSNRLILGDSLEVMSSLANREDLAGKVQLIYVDPPYGINFRSNFQVDISNRDVRDADSHLTREAEVVKAYRDTWTLGLHSYLSYLRDRLIVARALLTDSGSVFIQIGEEGLHRVRQVADEIFGPENSMVTIVVKKKSQSPLNQSVNDYLIWYAKDKSIVRWRTLKTPQNPQDSGSRFNKLELRNGARVPWSPGSEIPEGSRLVNDDYPIVSQDASATRSSPITINGVEVRPGANRHWSYDPDDGLRRLAEANRIRTTTNSARGVIYREDDPYSPIVNLWTEFMANEMRSM